MAATRWIQWEKPDRTRRADLEPKADRHRRTLTAMGRNAVMDMKRVDAIDYYSAEPWWKRAGGKDRREY